MLPVPVGLHFSYGLLTMLTLWQTGSNILPATVSGLSNAPGLAVQVHMSNVSKRSRENMRRLCAGKHRRMHSTVANQQGKRRRKKITDKVMREIQEAHQERPELWEKRRNLEDHLRNSTLENIQEERKLGPDDLFACWDEGRGVQSIAPPQQGIPDPRTAGLGQGLSGHLSFLRISDGGEGILGSHANANPQEPGPAGALPRGAGPSTDRAASQDASTAKASRPSARPKVAVEQPVVAPELNRQECPPAGPSWLNHASSMATVQPSRHWTRQNTPPYHQTSHPLRAPLQQAPSLRPPPAGSTSSAWQGQASTPSVRGAACNEAAEQWGGVAGWSSEEESDGGEVDDAAWDAALNSSRNRQLLQALIATSGVPSGLLPSCVPVRKPLSCESKPCFAPAAAGMKAEGCS